MSERSERINEHSAFGRLSDEGGLVSRHADAISAPLGPGFRRSGMLSRSRLPRWRFTASERTLTIVSVRSWTELLTKRRAVDFCRVATALCRTA
jgi:hypothetical protein